MGAEIKSIKKEKKIDADHAEKEIKTQSQPIQFSLLRSKIWKDDFEITAQFLEDMYNRNGPARNMIDFFSDRVFDKWFEPEDATPRLRSQLKELNDSVKFKENHKEAFTARRKHGSSIIVYNYDDAALTNTLPLENPVGINSMVVFDQLAIREFIYEDDTNKSGDIVAVKIHSHFAGTSDDLCIHRSRFDIIGKIRDLTVKASALFPAVNALEVYDNNLWSLGQSFFRHASGFPHFKKENADEEEIEKMRKMLRNITSETGFASDDTVELQFVGANGKALNPEPYFQSGLRAVSISARMPYVILEGAHAGQISGSETNTREVNNIITSMQNDEVTGYLKTSYQRFVDVGMLESLDFTFKWKTLFDLDEQVKADTMKKKVESMILLHDRGVVNDNEIRLFLGIKNQDSEPETDIPSGQEYTHLSLQTNTSSQNNNFSGDAAIHQSNLSTPPKTYGSNPPSSIQKLHDQEQSKFEENKKLNRDIQKNAQSLTDIYDWVALREAVTELKTKDSILDSIKRLVRISDDNTSEFLVKLNLIIDSSDKDFRFEVDTIVDEIYAEGKIVSEKELKALEVEVTSKIGDRFTSSKSTSKSTLFGKVKDVSSSMKLKLNNVLLDELRRSNGTNLTNVRKALTAELRDQQKSFTLNRMKVISRTESNAAFTDSNEAIYLDNGLKKWQAITARDDRVRPSHARVDGEIVTIGSRLSNGRTKTPFDPNCRCSMIPVV